MKAGYDAQLKSIILLKNKGKVLPLQKGKTIYIPKRFTPAARDWFGNTTREKLEYPVNLDFVKKYFNVTDDPTKADAALVFVKGPNSGVGYDKQDKEKGWQWLCTYQPAVWLLYSRKCQNPKYGSR